MKRRRISRQKKTALVIAGAGVATGILAVILWPQIRRIGGSITASKPTVKAKSIPSAAYQKGTAENVALNRAMDAWYEQHPDVSFVNDDGTYNILPGYELP